MSTALSECHGAAATATRDNQPAATKLQHHVSAHFICAIVFFPSAAL